ncbi:MAG TPA: putative selenate reductase subunit YgfK [Bacteroidales bacterium]|nr:putative selenate reductase subunit YgfK [Bacteroidales bacterium]
MNDKFNIIGIEQLFTIILNDYQERKEIFGIPEALFFRPNKADVFRILRYNQLLETPIGVAAGPQTQLAQNIISAWLCGARYIELKTIQTLDELTISKPCIDMQDEGYNCEWSQELKIKESYEEYLKAWILIHLLKHKFNWDNSEGLGVIFNMSVGYNLEGILKDNVQWFFNKMSDCSYEKEQMIKSLSKFYPEIQKINIPNQISNNITLSTMHGCPPDEIEKIASYLICDKKLHTTVKLNPTLLGAKELRTILNEKLGFKTTVPDIAFEHDLKYPDAIKIIRNLQNDAQKTGVQFSIKLTNTLESVNHKNIFPPHEKMMYMSGRALHPISINLAKKLQNEFNGGLDITFSAGVDAFNVTDVFTCNFRPITVSSDLLKPGGYGRLSQYIENLKGITNNHNALDYLNQYADNVLNNFAYHDNPLQEPNIKNNLKLNYFDCIKAPCMDACATHQDIPSYMYYTAKGDFQKAYEVILKKNPFPNSLGMVCNHACQTKCTRINYDDDLLIREIKRFVADYGNNESFLKPEKENGKSVAIIGAGPSGLSCAYFLRLAGFNVDIYEKEDSVGGMVAHAIPSFRLKKESLEKDVKRIENLGVRIHFKTQMTPSLFNELQKGYSYIYIAVGAQKFKTLHIPGDNAVGVCNPFEFLKKVKNKELYNIGSHVIVVGGGNTAMDVARTAYRLIPEVGKVTVLYRRTISEMPAEAEEIQALLDEGIEIMELVSPLSVIAKNERVVALKCQRMKLGEPDSSGRPQPIAIEGSEFELKADLIVPALGQEVDLDFIQDPSIKINKNHFETNKNNIYIGGDALHNASTFIRAVGDGRKVAENIFAKENIDFSFEPEKESRNLNYADYMIKKSKRIKGIHSNETPIEQRKSFDIVVQPLTKEEAQKEAARCLLCDDVCSVCVTVCPNRANYTYFTTPKSIPVYQVNIDGNQINIEQTNRLTISQSYQIINIADFCNECGNCSTFCPTQGAPYKDKPKFYLTQKSFAQTAKGFYFDKETNTLHFKEENKHSTLKTSDDYYFFENKELKITFTKHDFKIKHIEIIQKSASPFNTQTAAHMIALADAAKNLY